MATESNAGAGWRGWRWHLAGLIVGALGIAGCLLLVASSLRQHETALAVERLQADVFALASIENSVEAGEANIGMEDFRAVKRNLLTHLDEVTERLPPLEGARLREQTVVYMDAVEVTVSGFLSDGDGTERIDDEATEQLFLSLEARLDRLTAEADTASRGAARAASQGLAFLLVVVFTGVAALFTLGGRVQRRAGVRGEARRRDARFRAIVENLRDFVVVLGDEGEVRYVSPSIEAELQGRPVPKDVDELLERVLPASRDASRRLLAGTGSAGPVQVEVVDADGNVRYLDAVVSDQRENPHVSGLVITARDVTERVRLEKRLRQQATTDALTGLPNRRALNDASARAVARARRRRSNVGMVMIDLDGFKGINDALGHPVGDELLRQVARRLRSVCRAGELLVRLGGDEFAVLLEDVSSTTDAESLARRLRQTVDEPYELGDDLIVIHASFGVAVVGVRASASEPAGGDLDSSMGFDDLFRHADVALYEAKERGRQQIVAYEPGMDNLMQTDLRLRREIASGFASGEFELAYQPLLDVRTSRPVGLEALMRWNSASLGPVSPTVFIPMAERSGIISELGRWALRTACAQLEAWQGEQLPDDLSMSVNVSIMQLQDHGFVDQLKEIIEETGIAPSDLVLEVTESVLAQRPGEISAVLARVQDLGVKVALDDFGTGYSSMSQLQRLPIDVIKIDKEFVHAISEGEPASRSVVNTLVALGRSMGLRTVAEGVEDLEQLEALTAQQCDLAQGFLFARPMPPSETLEFLRTFRLPAHRGATI